MLHRALSLLVLTGCLALVGCNAANPGTWTQAEVEAYMLKTEDPKMVEVKLTPNPEGGFTGVGKGPDGEKFDLKIKQNPSLKQLSWEANGDRGTVITDGKYEFVN